MKNATQHVREFKKLQKKIRKENATPFPAVEDPMEQLLRGILTDYASETRANAALARIWEAVVDINDLRVTPVAEIVEAIGPDFPMCRRASEDIVKALIVVFNKLHHLDLSFLKKAGRRTAESFLNSLDGVNPHARATVTLRCLKGHAVPADMAMCDFLRGENCVEPDSTTEQIQKFLAGQIRESQASAFYAQFKRYAATHVPKKVVAPPPAAPIADTRTAPEAAVAEPAGKNKHEKAVAETKRGRGSSPTDPKSHKRSQRRSGAKAKVKASPAQKRPSRSSRAKPSARKKAKRSPRNLRRHR